MRLSIRSLHHSVFFGLALNHASGPFLATFCCKGLLIGTTAMLASRRRRPWQFSRDLAHKTGSDDLDSHYVQSGETHKEINNKPPTTDSLHNSAMDHAHKPDHVAPGVQEAPHSHSHANSSGECSHSHSQPGTHKTETLSHQQHSHSHTDDHSHSHSILHSHSHGPNELLGRGFLTNPAVRITWIGLMVNISMAGAKAVGSVYFHSQALMADAIHSLSDMVADLLTLGTVNVGLKEGTFSRYPLGYGKIESVGTFLVSGVLLFAGFTVGWSSLLQIFEFVLPSHLYDYVLVLQVHSHSHSFGDTSGDAHGHSHSHSHVSTPDTAEKTVAEYQVPNINAAWLALGSIAVKELLYKKTMKVAAKTNSKVLVANAWHHRIDSLTAAVAFVTITASYLFGVVWLDAVGGLAVSLLILHAGFSTFKDAWFELIDRGASKKSDTFVRIKLLVELELEVVREATKTDLQLEDIAVLTAGARSNVSVKLGTTENVSLSALNKLEYELVSGLREKDNHLGRVFIEYELKKDQHAESKKPQ